MTGLTRPATISGPIISMQPSTPCSAFNAASLASAFVDIAWTEVSGSPYAYVAVFWCNLTKNDRYTRTYTKEIKKLLKNIKISAKSS